MNLTPPKLLLALCLASFAIGQMLAATPFAKTDSNSSGAHEVAPMKTNLALGRPALYSIPPKNPKGEGTGPTSVLTDGVRHADGSRKMQNFVEFNGGSSMRLLDTTGVNLCVDLGEPQPVGKVTLNISGHSRFRKPHEVSVLGSMDGIHFYEVGTQRRRLSYASTDGPYTTFFNTAPPKADARAGASEDAIKQSGTHFWKTLTFDLGGAKARYIGFNVKGSGTIAYMNELEVFAADPVPSDPLDLYVTERLRRFPIGHGLAPQDDVWFGPVKEKLTIATNITTPTFFHLKDVRPKPTGASPLPALEFVIDLPEGVEMHETKTLLAHGLRHEWDEARRRNRYVFRVDPALNNESTRIFKWEELGPFYFKTDRTLSGEEFAISYARTADKTYGEKRKPIHTLTIPKVSGTLPFYSGLTWMREDEALDWPGFLDAYTHIGFNHLPVFPREYMKPTNGFEMPENVSTLIKSAREKGLGIVYNESPLHLITDKEAQCITSNDKAHFCPSYTGKGYVSELQRIRTISEKIKPDLLFADIEVFGGTSAKDRRECTRCRAALAASGLSTPDTFKAQGTRIAKDIAKAAKDGHPGMPMGMYNVADGVYHGIFSFEDLYPETLQFAQASLYEAGHLDVYHQKFVADRANTGENWKSIPWITAGTYGEFPSYKLESMIYDAVLNGNAVSFYCFLDFDTAQDYYYVAEALSNLSSHQNLLESGNPVPYKGSNEGLFYSCFANEKEALVHIGNYTSSETETVALKSPLAGAVVIEDARTGKVLSKDGEVVVSIDPQRSTLLFFKPSSQESIVLTPPENSTQ